MRPNRFPGLDRYDGGQRVAYGLNLGAYLAGGMSVRAFVAQSFSFQENRAMPIGSGAEDQRSDIVGRFVVSPSEYLDLLYRFRIDKDNFAPRRHEIGAAGGPSWLSSTAAISSSTPRRTSRSPASARKWRWARRSASTTTGRCSAAAPWT